MAGPVNDSRPAAECIHCGFCLETCPTYALTGKEEESPRGRILLAHALADERVPFDSATLAPLDHCLGCLACETACPSGVVYRDILFETRRRAEEHGHVRATLERFLLRHVITHPGRLRALGVLYRLPGVRAVFRVLAHAPFLPRTWRERATLGPSFERRQKKPSPVALKADAPRAVLLRGCAARVFMPATEDAMAHLLERAGYRVRRLDRPRCCGALAHHAGMHGLARELAEETIDALGEDAAAIIVPTAAGCGAHLRDLAFVLEPGENAARAGEVGRRVRDLTEALLEAEPLRFTPSGNDETVVFQDPCHLRHAQGIVLEPRRLLREAGARLVETQEADLCCGSAGTYHLASPGLSLPLARRKRDALLGTGAQTVVTANPGCWIQLQAVWPSDGPRLVTLARFLEERLAEGGLPNPVPVRDHASSLNSEKKAP